MRLLLPYVKFNPVSKAPRIIPWNFTHCRPRAPVPTLALLRSLRVGSLREPVDITHHPEPTIQVSNVTILPLLLRSWEEAYQCESLLSMAVFLRLLRTKKPRV